MAGLFTFVELSSFSGCLLTAACVDNDGALCCCADETLKHQREKQTCITPFFFHKISISHCLPILGCAYTEFSRHRGRVTLTRWCVNSCDDCLHNCVLLKWMCSAGRKIWFGAHGTVVRLWRVNIHQGTSIVSIILIKFKKQTNHKLEPVLLAFSSAIQTLRLERVNKSQHTYLLGMSSFLLVPLKAVAHCKNLLRHVICSDKPINAPPSV